MKAILIGDAGSTKTDWAILQAGKEVHRTTTMGINPYQQSAEEIVAELTVLQLLLGNATMQLILYGAGLIGQSELKIETAAQVSFPQLAAVELHSDVVGAARALCGRAAGIACILGTGSNSCLYDGKAVMENIGGFGYVLGDEGSGAYLGIQLLKDFLYDRMPSALRTTLIETYQLDRDTIYERVYRAAFPNRYLASFAPFLAAHRAMPYVQTLLRISFTTFLDSKVKCYDNYRKYPIHFTGSIAKYFESSLTKVMETEGLQLGKIHQKPIDGLVAYHLSGINS